MMYLPLIRLEFTDFRRMHVNYRLVTLKVFAAKLLCFSVC